MLCWMIGEGVLVVGALSFPNSLFPASVFWFLTLHLCSGDSNSFYSGLGLWKGSLERGFHRAPRSFVAMPSHVMVSALAVTGCSTTIQHRFRC